MTDRTPTASHRLPCACGAIVEAHSGEALLDAVEAHIAGIHGHLVAASAERQVADDDAVVVPPTFEKGR